MQRTEPSTSMRWRQETGGASGEGWGGVGWGGVGFPDETSVGVGEEVAGAEWGPAWQEQSRARMGRSEVRPGKLWFGHGDSTPATQRRQVITTYYVLRTHAVLGGASHARAAAMGPPWAALVALSPFRCWAVIRFAQWTN